MFEAFYSTKSGGSGLGLPTAKRIIEAHGGSMDVESEVGRGTKFTVILPIPPRLPALSGQADAVAAKGKKARARLPAAESNQPSVER